MKQWRWYEKIKKTKRGARYRLSNVPGERRVDERLEALLVRATRRERVGEYEYGRKVVTDMRMQLRGHSLAHLPTKCKAVIGTERQRALKSILIYLSG